MKKRAQQKTSPGSETRPAPVSARSSTYRQREHESRLAHSRLASQSVLSLSGSESGEEDPVPGVLSRQTSVGQESAIVANAASVGMHRPSVGPRKLHSSPGNVEENTLRHSASTTKTSGSIPMRLGSDVPMPPLPIPADRSTLSSPRMADSTAGALRKLNGSRDSASQPSRSRPTTRSAADDSRSMAEETTSSATDGSRMMQVSEEEMILLELMRQKRAAMQKNSFSEGYRLALKQEEEHLAHRREGAHQTALQLLKAREELKRQSATSTLFSEDHEHSGAAAMRRKYSALHKEDVDKSLKLERFLSLDPHGQVQVVPGADQFPAPSIVVDEEDEGQEEPPMLLQPKTYSPMQKLTQKVRDGTTTSSAPMSHSNSAGRSRSASQSPLEDLDDDYMEHHHDRVRAFLAANNASEAGDLFPTPPNRSRMSMLNQEDWQSNRGSMILSPSPVPEEEPILDDLELLRPTRWEPERSKKSSKSKSRDRRSDYRRSYTAQADPLLETAVGLTPQHQHKLHDPYPDITPTLDSGPLELPSAGFTGSPSLSSRPSPVTPEFPHVAASDKTSVGGIEIAGSDNASYRGEGRAYTPDTEFSAPRTTHAYAKKPAKRAGPPAAIDPLASKRNMDRITSMSSITSAGEDVLAAWAELGGGNSDFNFRKPGKGGR